jgi:hypothetical protein
VGSFGRRVGFGGCLFIVRVLGCVLRELEKKLVVGVVGQDRIWIETSISV